MNPPAPVTTTFFDAQFMMWYSCKCRDARQMSGRPSTPPGHCSPRQPCFACLSSAVSGEPIDDNREETSMTEAAVHTTSSGATRTGVSWRPQYALPMPERGPAISSFCSREAGTEDVLGFARRRERFAVLHPRHLPRASTGNFAPWRVRRRVALECATRRRRRCEGFFAHVLTTDAGEASGGPDGARV